MRVVKSVSLPVELAEKAEELPNFSIFIQECLQHGSNQEKAKQIEVAALKRQIAIREAALYRIIHDLKFSKAAQSKIIDLLSDMGVYVEELRDF